MASPSRSNSGSLCSVLPRKKFRIELLRVEFRQIALIELAQQKFAARVFFEFLFPDADPAEREEEAPWTPKRGGAPPAEWYGQHVSWLNALEPPTVLWQKIVRTEQEVRFSMEVFGEFLEDFELADFPVDVQFLSVLMEFQLANEGISPVELSIEKAKGNVNHHHFVWKNEYTIGDSMSVGVGERKPLETRSYQHVICSASLLRNPFFFLVNVSLPNMLLAAMAGLQFLVDVDDVADRASISLTLLLVCASYFQFSASLTPKLAYLTLLDKHSLWCIFVVIVMVLWVAMVKIIGYLGQVKDLGPVDFIAGCSFVSALLLSQSFFLCKFLCTRRRSKTRIAEPAEAHCVIIPHGQSCKYYPVRPYLMPKLKQSPLEWKDLTACWTVQPMLSLL